VARHPECWLCRASSAPQSWRSVSQPFRAGLKFSGRPSGPWRLEGCAVSSGSHADTLAPVRTPNFASSTTAVTTGSFDQVEGTHTTMLAGPVGSWSCDVLFQQDKVQIIPERCAEALVIVGKRLGFARQEVTPAFIPADQCRSDVHH
jgi:hypothetical protein